MITLQAETVPVEPTPYILAWDGSIPPPVPQFDDTRDQPSDSEPCCTSSFLPADFTLHTFEVRPRCRVCQTPFLLRLRDALPDRPVVFSTHSMGCGFCCDDRECTDCWRLCFQLF